jgi:murein DD-endopeptidase MepM/ murein hydrolase activator NlpD
MRLGIAGRHRRRLTRGAALLVLGGLAAGCSSDVTRFQDSIVTGSTQAPARAAPVNQSYPGGIDHTHTGSVAAQPQQRQGGGILNRAGLLPRPAENVGGTSLASAAGQVVPQHQPLPAPSSSVSQGPALAPVARSQLDATPASAPQPVQQAQPVQQSQQPGNLAAQQPGERQPQQPQEPNQLAVLPQQPKVQERDVSTANAQAGTASSDSAPAPGGTYTVAAGDTLSAISRRSGVSVDSLKAANGLSNGLIRIGQQLTIPNGGQVPQQARSPESTQTAQASSPASSGGTSSSSGGQGTVSSYTPPVTSGEQIQTASIDPGQARPEASSTAGMRWPVRGRIISGFGQTSGGRTNDGIDIAVPEGTSVRAAESGVVIYAGDGLREFGNTVLVRHDDGLVTVYGHNSKINVSRGDTVRRGQEIAISGTSGSAETPRLHFEVRKDSTPVDPTTFLE